MFLIFVYYYIKWRFDCPGGNCNLGNCKFPRKKNQDFNEIRTHGGLCVSAAVLYQLSYEDPYIGSRPIFLVHLKPWKEWILAWRWCELQKYYFKWRFNHRRGNCNLGNCKFTQKEFRDFNGIQTHSLCVSAAVLYQLSYEDPCIGSRPICWVHLNPWKEWSIGYLNFVNCGNTSYFKWRLDCHAVL